jgi:Fe2+ or Zn2+ uptake regulation protein
MKLTPKRKEIINMLKNIKNFTTARQLSNTLPHIDQATVYRTLDLLVKENLAKKFVFDGTESVYEHTHQDHHHAVCNDCEKVIHFNVSDKKVIDSLNIKDFDITSVELVVKGNCKK